MLHYTAYRYRDCTIETAASDGYIDGKWQGYYRVSLEGKGSFGAAIPQLEPTRDDAEEAALAVGKREVDQLLRGS